MNILLIQLKRIGDLILTTPALAALRNKFPDAKIALAVSRDVASLLPAIPELDRAYALRRNLADAGIFASVALQRFDYCVDFTRNDRSAFLSLLSRANKRIVSYRVKRRAPWRGRAYNEFVEHRMRDMHTIDYNLSLLEPLGIEGTAPPVRLTLPENADADADQLLPAGIHGPFVIFHPGSARVEKFWEPDRWASVITHAMHAHGLNAILTGGTSRLERSHLGEIMAHLSPPATGAPGMFVDLSGQMDLLTLAALISRARLLVTVDSAPVHFAAATATPQVALFGPTNPFHWRPRDSPALILQGDSGIPLQEFVPRQARLPMKLISTPAVINAMDALLSTPAA